MANTNTEENKILTFEEFLRKRLNYTNSGRHIFSLGDLEIVSIEYAKYHVELALKAASEVPIKSVKKSQYGKYRKWQKVKEGEEVDLFKYILQYSQDKDSILNAYNLDNIK